MTTDERTPDYAELAREVKRQQARTMRGARFTRYIDDLEAAFLALYRENAELREALGKLRPRNKSREATKPKVENRADDNAIVFSTNAYVSHRRQRGDADRSSFSMSLAEAIQIQRDLEEAVYEAQARAALTQETGETADD